MRKLLQHQSINRDPPACLLLVILTLITSRGYQVPADWLDLDGLRLDDWFSCTNCLNESPLVFSGLSAASDRISNRLFTSSASSMLDGEPFRVLLLQQLHHTTIVLLRALVMPILFGHESLLQGSYQGKASSSLGCRPCVRQGSGGTYHPRVGFVRRRAIGRITPPPAAPAQSQSQLPVLRTPWIVLDSVICTSQPLQSSGSTQRLPVTEGLENCPIHCMPWQAVGKKRARPPRLLAAASGCCLQ